MVLATTLMKHLTLYVVTLNLVVSLSAQDTLTITLSPFTKKQDQSEDLYVAVFIKSNISDSIEIDDSRSWINCINALGVKLIAETLYDDCFREVDGSDCHPTVNISGDYFQEALKRVKLGGFGEYSYVVRVLPLLLVEDTGLRRIFRNVNPYRFKLELPYKYGQHWGTTSSRNWVYYAYPR